MRISRAKVAYMLKREPPPTNVTRLKRLINLQSWAVVYRRYRHPTGAETPLMNDLQGKPSDPLTAPSITQGVQEGKTGIGSRSSSVPSLCQSLGESEILRRGNTLLTPIE